MDSTEARKQVALIKNEEEHDAASLLLNMGLDFIGSDIKVTNNYGQSIGEIDLLFSFEDYLMIIEVSKDKHTGNSKKITFFTKWADSSNLDLLRKKCGLRPMKSIRIYFDLAIRSFQNTSVEAKRITESENMNKIAYKDDYEYFKDSQNKIGRWSMNDFLNWLEFPDQKTSEGIESIQFYMGNVPVFCFVARVDNLLKTCYVSRRRNMDMGYQRTLKKDRVGKISENIKNGKGLSFPNSILISVPNLTNSVAKPEECPKVVEIHFPTGYSTCRIIDGQHRLLGFSAISSELQKTHYLPVIALQDYDIEKEIQTFIDINSKQQRIDGNLILLLKADRIWEKNTKEYKERIAVKVSQYLNNSFLKNRIYFGTADKTKGSNVTLSTLVSALIVNNQIMDSVKETRSRVQDVFKLVQKYIPNNAFQEGHYFGQNRGIRVLFRLLYLYQRNVETGKISISEKNFFKELGDIINDDLIKELEDLYGEGGANAATTLLFKRLQSEYSEEYSNVVTNLNALKGSVESVESTLKT